MFRKLIKCSVLSMMVLTSVVTPQITTNATTNTKRNSIKYTRTIHTKKQLIQQAKHDSNYDYKKGRYGVYESSDYKWFNRYRKLLKFNTYRKAYLKNILYLNWKHRTPNENVKSDNNLQTKYFNALTTYVNLPNNIYKLGVYGGSNNNDIKKQYAKNTRFAYGYIKGSIETNSPGVMSAYLNYQDNNGKLSYQQLGLNRYHNAELFGKRIGKKVYFNALTAKYINKIFKKSGFSKKYYPDYFDGVNENAYNESKYAKNIINNYSLHRKLYFPKQVTMDTTRLAGIELSKYNNKVTRTTAVNFKKYFDNYYISKHTPQFQKQFRTNYKINTIYVKSYTNNYPNNATNKYYIYHNNQKRSGIYFDMDNSQHIGQMPNTKGL